MLREISSTQQSHQNKLKRWFTDADMDLFIWFRNQVPVCFQLSYNKQQQEHSVSWHIESGFTHNLVKPGNRPSKYRMSFIHSPECEFDVATTAQNFLRASQESIEVPLADFIFARLLEFPSQHDKHSNQVIAS